MLPKSWLAVAVLGAAACFAVPVACGSPSLSGDNPPDSGPANQPPDAALTESDASSGDSGVRTDSGTVVAGPDAGEGDAGMGPLPGRGGVNNDGGAVDRLYFAVTGDTRPPLCDLFLYGQGYDYPTAKVTQIADEMEVRQTQFALDLGDHMFVCVGGSTEANAQMNTYMTAIANFKAPFFMSMGNHECIFALGGALDDCGANNTSDPAYTAFMSALAPISPKPYYSVDIGTSMGLARFVFVADDAWDSTESTWLGNVLTDADTKATYTIVSRHHNLAASTSGNYAAIVKMVQSHKYALHLTAHTHTYLHDLQQDPTGRTVIVGTGGSSDATMDGYATVVQGLDGNLYFTMYDSTTDLPIDHWTVGPNP
jgi:hypothetical protein